MPLSDEYELASAPTEGEHWDAYKVAPLDVVYTAWYRAYREGRFDVPDQRTPDVDGLYDHACSLVEDRNWSWALIEEELSCLNGGFYDGVFVSALINTRDAEQITISHVPDARNPERGLTGKIGHVGYRNTKDLIIEDDAGTHTGVRMEDGSITIHGDASRSVGRELSGGHIHVKGDVGSGLGWKMQGGTLTVDGDVRSGTGGPNDVGYGMDGGRIHVRGDVDSNIGGYMQDGTVHVHGAIEGTIGILGDGGVIKQERDSELVQIWPEEDR